MSIIEGKKIVLRPACETDLDLLADWFSNPEFVIWWGGTPKSREEVAEKYLGTDPARRAFIVEVKASPIGYIQAWTDDPPTGGIDIVLVPEAQGRGLGVEAVRTLALHLRTSGWREITIDPLKKNERAIRAFQKAGFAIKETRGEHLILAFEDEPVSSTKNEIP